MTDDEETFAKADLPEYGLASRAQIAASREKMEDTNLFILDTGATTNSTGSSLGMINVRDSKGTTTLAGNGKTMSTKAIGDIKVNVCNKK